MLSGPSSTHRHLFFVNNAILIGLVIVSLIRLVIVSLIRLVIVSLIRRVTVSRYWWFERLLNAYFEDELLPVDWFDPLLLIVVVVVVVMLWL